MDVMKMYSLRSLVWILLFFTLLCLTFQTIFHMMVQLGTARADALADGFIPISAGIFGFSGLLLWLFLRFSVSRLVRRSEALNQTAKKLRKGVDTARQDQSERTERVKADKRNFLHLLSVFQREGRLLDFFSEELDEYEDEQIGAAVRSIQDNCRKTLNKYLNLKSVLDQEEDEEITVPQGFDPAVMKLVGNVTGEPPFKGVVRHRGWKAVRLELPTLSGDQNPDIIAPAEVEIL